MMRGRTAMVTTSIRNWLALVLILVVAIVVAGAVVSGAVLLLGIMQGTVKG